MFGVEEMKALLAEGFAPWVQALQIEPLELEAGVGRFRMPCGPQLARRGGTPVLCGQAVAAAADTAAVLTLAALNGRYRNLTTVDLSTHFLRPVTEPAAEIRVEAASNGRRMAVARVELRGWGEAGTGKLAAVSTAAFAYLED